MNVEKDNKSENCMTNITLPKFSESEISNANNSSCFGLDFFDSDSSIISEFMSLSLNAKIEKFKLNSSFRKLKDKNSSNTFLHYICMNDDNYPMMNLISPSRNEMDSQNNLGQSPLHISIINKNYKISTFLIQNGADVNLPDNNLNTSLHLAVKNGNINIILLLIKYKANPYLLNKDNESILDIAIKLDKKDCINLIKEITLKNDINNNKIKNNLNNTLKKNINYYNKNKIYNKNELIYSNNIKLLNANRVYTFNKKAYYRKITYNYTLTPKINNNVKIINLDNNKKEERKNLFLSISNNKSRQRTNSTSIIDPTNKTYEEQIYTKKIVPRSQSGASTYIKSVETNIFKEKGNSSYNIFTPPEKNLEPRKTEFPMQNEMFLECDNESEEEEKSIIRENPEGITPNTLLNSKYLRTIRVSPLTEINNKKNPFWQIDSYVSAIHKTDQGITESDGYIREDGLLIIEPSIDVSNADDITNEQSSQNQTENYRNSFKREKKIIKDDIIYFLKNIGMEQYSDLLIEEGFDDINLIISQMKNGIPIHDDALREIGIIRPGDRAKILIRIQEISHLFGFKIPFEAVYYINKKPFNLLKYDFHVKSMQNWLKKIQLEKYLENFYNGGYYSPELIFIQKASKFPINDTILERDLKIKNANDRKLIMSSISSNSNNYISELQKIADKKKNNTNNNENNTKNKEKEENMCFIF